ncbi:MAG TPA: YdeI/OmpD-associated family protein, partial [Gemmatimonadaceae bacterium]|nr:YdeI/OmpD-associated family protein [Gemmatimonadaceae bacterium]
WLVTHHATATELLVGFHKVNTGRPSLTWPQSVDEALCFGWIDGVRRRIDDDSYSIRFTPRKPTSIWSAVNIKRVAELEQQGRMTDAGRAAFARRDPKRSQIYSFERGRVEMDGDALARLKADKQAWAYFESQAPYYRRTSSHWVASAKKPETREKRLQILIDCCRNGERIPPLSYGSDRKGS